MIVENPICNRCEKPLKTNNVVWLELAKDSMAYPEGTEIPIEESMGGFPFGKDCAKIELRQTEEDPHTYYWLD